MKITPELLAYCAGVMDSDGHIGVHVNWYRVKSVGDSKQPTYQPRLAVKQIDAGAVEVFHDLFNGHRYLDHTAERKGSGRPIWVWQVHSRSVRVPLEAIRPYLRIKGRQADLALELCDLNASTRRRHFVLPDLIPGEPMLPLAEACEAAGRSYAVGVQCVKLGNIPFERRGRRVFVPASFVDTWRDRARGAMRHPDLTERMAGITEEIKALNSGARGQSFATPRR